MKPETLRALHAEWRKLSPNLAIEPMEGETPAQAERRVRLAWTNSALVTRPDARRLWAAGRHSSLVTSLITSWNELTQGQARFLLKKMRGNPATAPPTAPP